MLSGARTRCEEAPGVQMRQSSSEDRFNSMIQIWNIIWKAHDFEYTIYIYNLNGIETELPLTAQKVSLSPSPSDSKATNSRR
jgi:hypothetical protein